MQIKLIVAETFITTICKNGVDHELDHQKYNISKYTKLMPLRRGLLISCKRNFEQATASEIHFTLTEKLGIPKEDIKLVKTRISGLVSVFIRPIHDLYEIMNGLIQLEKDEAYFLHCLKIRPLIDTTKIPEMNFDPVRARIPILIKDKDPNSTYKLEVVKRHSQLRTQDIIKELAPEINFKVDLTNPDWIFLVEILADHIGISAIPPEFIFSTSLANPSEQEGENWFLD